MKRALKHRNRIPYGGGYVITDPMTGIQVSGGNFDMLLRSAMESRRANSVPIGIGFEQELETWVCEKYPSECEDIGEGKIRKRYLTLRDIVAGSQVMLSQVMNSRKVVDREEAERRGQICVNCPLNDRFSKPCHGMCPELAAVVGWITGAQGTRHDAALHGCQICGCFNQAAIWVPLDAQWKALTDEQKEQFKTAKKTLGCWKCPENV